jgi:hypothetical protein
MTKLQNINKGGRVTMKNSIRIVLVGLATVMIFAAVQAFGKEFKKGPNVDTLEVVSGCVLSLHDGGKDDITLCRSDEPIGCFEDGNGDCNECEHEDVTTILGIGPAYYWENADTLEIDDSTCLPITDESEQYTVMEATSAIPQPGPGDNVTIGYYPCPDGEDLIALWVVVKTNDGVSAVLLRNQDTLEVLWKGKNKDKKEKKKTNSDE